MNNKNILIIDDEIDVIKALSARLEPAGYTVLTAQDGITGLKKARLEKPDLIILDVMLPKLNGFKIARFLKFDDNYKQIPIIVLSARAEEEDKKLGRETGIDLYLTKPYDVEDLMGSIEKLLS